MGRCGPRLFCHTPFFNKKVLFSQNIKINSHVIHINYPKKIHIPSWYLYPALKCNQPGLIMISSSKVIDS